MGFAVDVKRYALIYSHDMANITSLKTPNNRTSALWIDLLKSVRHQSLDRGFHCIH